MLISWIHGGRPGQPSLQYEILGSAYGGGNGNDGASAVATHTSNLHITPIEILETEFPCRIAEFAMVQDSCGAGEFRGGLAFRRIYELLQDASVVRRYDRAKFPPNGVAGGKPGSRSRFVIHLGAEASAKRRPRAATSCAPASASCCKAPAAAATATKKRDRAALKRESRKATSRPFGRARLRQQGLIVMADSKKDRVGIVGAGRMGLSMLKHLVKKGYAVTVCDISEKQREAARAAGAVNRDNSGRSRQGKRHRHPRRRLRRRGQRRRLR